MTLEIKEGVDFAMLDPRIIPAVWKCHAIYDQYGKPCVITSGRDSKHSCMSKHYFGMAVDLRTRFFSESQKIKVSTEIRDALGKDFDVILESDHIHVEYDPEE